MKSLKYLSLIIKAGSEGNIMSNLQKVILIIGTIVFVIVMWTSTFYYRGDEGIAFARGISVIAVTAVLFFVTKRKRNNQD